MALNEEQVRGNLAAFASRWGDREWGERENAQTFLNELFTCFGIDRLEAGARFEHFQAGEFYDLLWPGRVLIEMKASSEKDRLAKHRVQAMGYWERAADESKGIPQPQYGVLCAFHRLEVWEPGRFSASSTGTRSSASTRDYASPSWRSRSTSPCFRTRAAPSKARSRPGTSISSLTRPMACWQESSVRRPRSFAPT